MKTRNQGEVVAALAAAVSLLLGGASIVQAADVSVGSVAIRPNEQGTVAVTLNVESGETAVGTLVDMEVESGAAVPPRPGVVAVLAEDIDADDTAIPVGDAGDLQPFGTIQIGDEMISYGRKDGNTLVVGGCVGGEAGPACIDSSECGAGDTCEARGRGQGGTTPATHRMNDAVSTPSIPDCRMSGALDSLNKDAVFSYLPADCIPGTNCDTVRGIVIALDNLSPFPEGSTTLFNCKIDAGAQEGNFRLVCADGEVSGPPNELVFLADGPCGDGEVVVSVGADPTATPPITPTATSDPTVTPTRTANTTPIATSTMTATATPTMTASVTPTANACIGDCDGDGKVTVAELVQGMNIALGLVSLDECLAVDADGDGSLTVDEVIQAVASALGPCR